jgi:hypothetical protein
MAELPQFHASHARGWSRLAIDGIAGLTSLVEAVHKNIAGAPLLLGSEDKEPTTGTTGFVYRSIQGVTRVVGVGVDTTLSQLSPYLTAGSPAQGQDGVRAALNGVMGDYLVATGNPLALTMALRHHGTTLTLEKKALRASIQSPTRKLLVLVHGLCMNDLQWNRDGHDHGASLERDLGYTPVYLVYPSGVHVSTNGRAFAGLLEKLVSQWPVPLRELTIVCHSMGGLVTRSACHYAAEEMHSWPKQLRHIFFLGTPHHGAPLERGGNWVNVALGITPYSAPFARLGKIRGAGITDLRHGNLLDDDWEGRDRFAHWPDQRQIVPLPDGVTCHALAATVGKEAASLKGRLLGDGLVPVHSALGRHKDPERTLSIPESQQWIGFGMNHMELLSRPDVYSRIRESLSRGSREQQSRAPRAPSG